MKMNRRHQISRTVGILGTCRRFLLLAVRRVKEEEDRRYSQEELPWTSTTPGNAAPGSSLESRSSVSWNGSTPLVQCLGSPRRPTPATSLLNTTDPARTLENGHRAHGGIPLKHALRVKAAEYWLILGEVDEALRELDALPKRTWNYPWPLRVRLAAVNAVREMNRPAYVE
jgi:hypothetical protein